MSINLKQYILDEEFSRKLPESLARRYQAILLKDKQEYYLVGMVDTMDIFAVDELGGALKKPLRLVTVIADDLKQKLDQLYRRTSEITSFADELASELTKTPQQTDAKQNIEKDDPAVIKLLNSLLEDAVQVGASDIHIEPSENILRIRLRVDGWLQEQTISIAGREYISQALGQRLKLISGLNIAERRLPQDGRFETTIYGKRIEIRISTMPIQYGESIVLRLLNKFNRILNLDGAGMSPQMLARFRKLIKLPSGIILVTGPTGSGKTTTLYGALTEINDVAKNIITIEDPIEYTLERLNQVQINTQIDLSFARVLRSALRQDPNIILIGEIRDQETASIALRAALTGHLVFATLHTNDAASTAVRLLDMGAESYLVAATVRVIIAQRLVRKICTSCAAPYQPGEEEIVFFTNFFGESFKDNTFSHGSGCAYCSFTGYRGMIGVFEMLELNGSMREKLRLKDTNGFMQLATHDSHASSLLGSAFTMAKNQVTSLNEVMRLSGE
jgi:MSHA biogenesis protein MshE